MDIVGYQGIEGSFSEEATIEFEKRLGKSFEKVGLVTSEKVVDSLLSEKINYGVLATENTTAGVVEETRIALDKIEYEIIDSLKLPIHHCVYIRKDKNVRDIEAIVSHEQAIKQTVTNREKMYPNIKTIEVEDTAIAAKMLFDGKINDNYAVICSKRGGEINNLKLIGENIEDSDTNMTTFILVKEK